MPAQNGPDIGVADDAKNASVGMNRGGVSELELFCFARRLSAMAACDVGSITATR